jgi:peptidyl-prolyl cis-trans isomerase D
VNYAAEKGYSVYNGNNVNTGSNSVGQLAEARQLVTWMYGDASIGDVEDFDLGDDYIVAVYKSKVEAGLAKLSNVRSEIKLKVENAKKAKYIEDQLANASGALSDIAASFDATAQVYSDTQLQLGSNSLPNVGTSPIAIGKAFALKNAGDRSKPIVTETGVVIVDLKSKSESTPITDYTNYVNQVSQRMASNTQIKLSQSIKEKAEIVDKRYKFY